jgi:hypothetical protein
MVPLVPVTLNMTFPDVREGSMETVSSVAPDPPVTTGGVKAFVRESPPTEKLTSLVNPFRGMTVILYCAVWPGATTCGSPEIEAVKSGDV